MTGDRNHKIVVAVALTLLTALTAQAQSTGSNSDNKTRQPVTDTRGNLPGWMFTSFPTNGTKADPPKINPFGQIGGAQTNIKPLTGPGAGIGYIDGGRTVIYQGGYGYPGYYPYGNAGTTVIVNQNPVIYPVGNIGAGQGGYESTPSTVTVVQTDPSGRTRMSTSTSSVFNGFAVPGYTTSFVSGQTVYSPFGAYIGCPRFVYSRYVIVGASYPYLNGRNTNLIISPWSASDPYINADANRGQNLGLALRDFSRFWEQGNAAGLRRRVQPDVPVAVFDAGQLVYSLRRVDFLALAADALDQVQTVSFRFTDIRERNDGLVNAYAIHTYRSRTDGTTHSVQICYTLVYLNGDWYLSAASIAP